MAITQTHFRFRTDANAVDATPTWSAAEDANPSPATTPFRLRLGLNGTSAASGEFEIYAQKNAGSYAAITTSATGGVQSYDASSDADDTMLRVPRLTMSTAWWLAGAALDLDLAGNRIYPSGAFTDYLSCSRASDGYAKNSAGEWVQFSSNVMRRTDLGLLIEGTRTNYLLNSATPATQETESLSTGDYTLWVEGSGSAIASNGTGTISGAESATDGSPSVFTITGGGTVNVTVTGTLQRFQLEKGGFASSWISTTTSSATRAEDDLAAAGDLLTLAGAATNTSVIHTAPFLDSSVAHELLYCDTGGGYDYRCGTNAPSQVFSITPAELAATLGGGTLWTTSDLIVGYSQDGTGRSLVANGGTVATDANIISAGARVFVGVGSAPPAFTYFRRLTVWNSRLADATLRGFTAP